MDDIQQNHSNALDEARRKDQERQQSNSGHQQSMKNAEIQNQKRLQSNSDNKKTKEKKKSFNPFAVLAQIDMLNDMPYFCTMLGSILKDILDELLAETVIMPILFSVLNGIFGLMMMQLAKYSEKKAKVHSRMTVRIIVWIVGNMFDSLPGLDFLPMSIATTLIVYVMTLQERAKASKDEKVSK